MKFFWILIVSGALLITGQLTAAAEGDWVFVEERRGVTIQSRKVAGHAESEFKGSRIINHPLEVVGAVLADIPAYPRWFLNCTQATKIPGKQYSDLNFLLYIIIAPPWPLWNREVIYDARTRIDIGSGIIMVWGKALQDDTIPVKEKHVRVTDSTIEWKLERLDDNRTRLSFAERINIGGSIGSFLSDAGCKKTIFESLVNFGRIVSDPKYTALGKDLKGRYGAGN